MNGKYKGTRDRDRRQMRPRSRRYGFAPTGRRAKHVNASDALLTLSTCRDDERVVLLARRLREGESAEDVAAKIAG